MVSLEWYRSFVAVYRVGTVSGAAKGLHLTQPAVSQHVAALEAALGMPLFERMPRKMLPTESGKRLYNQVIVAIETLEGVSGKENSAIAPDIIRLGAPADFFSEYGLNRWSAAQPENATHLHTSFGDTKDLIAQLLDGSLTGVIATQKIAHPELEYRPIFTEEFWLVAPPNAEVPVVRDKTDLLQLGQWLQTQPWIAYSADLPIIRRFWRVVFGKRLSLNPQFVIPDLRGIRRAIAQNLGYSVLPHYLCSEWCERGDLQLILRPAKPVSNTLWLAYRKTERNSTQIKQLIKLAEDV